MIDIPIDIDDAEKIVRGIMFPAHVKSNGRLRRAVFRRFGVDRVSVIRHTYMGSDFCKAKAKSASNVNAKYLGLAWLTAAAIRSVGSNVIDSREHYLGHADICHGIVIRRDEPEENALELNERLDQLVSLAVYRPDPSPQTDGWTGPII